MSNRWLIFAVAAALALGVGVSHAAVLAICLALAVLPALAFRQASRAHAYAVVSAYYLGALWPLAVGARNFFGSQASLVSAVLLWVVCALLLATPYSLLWSGSREQWVWRVPAALLLGALPPLGLIGFAWPGTALGLLFPGAGFFGLLGWLLISGINARHPVTIGFVLFWAVAANLLYLKPAAPAGWVAVDTHFGAIAHGTVAPLVEYNTVEAIAGEASRTPGAVVIFPESVVPRWTRATDALWQSAIEDWRRQGKTVVVGALIPLAMSPSAGEELREAVMLLRKDVPSDPTIPEFRRAAASLPVVMPYGLRNVAMIRGAQTGSFEQRVPVPFALWHPFSAGGARLNAFGLGVVPIAGERAAILICYEQVIPWTVLTAAFESPTVFVGISNDHWAMDTPMAKWQELCLRAWSRLFGRPYVLAVNT